MFLTAAASSLARGVAVAPPAERVALGARTLRVSEGNADTIDSGARIWDSGRALSGLLRDQLADADTSEFRVLELGAGTGIGGLTAAALGATTLLSDQPELLPLLDSNIDANSLRSHAAATQLMWGDASDAERVGASGPFDLIIGSDLLYAPQSFPLLLETLTELSVPGATEVLFTFPTRYTEGIFIEQAADADFETIEDVTEVDVNVWSLRLRLRD